MHVYCANLIQKVVGVLLPQTRITRTNVSSDASKKRSAPPLPQTPLEPEEEPYRLPRPKGNLCIIRPLAPMVQDLLRGSDRKLRATTKAEFSEGSPTRDSSAWNLLQAIGKGTVIWHLCGQFVVKLNSSVAVKFAEGMDTDEAITMTHIQNHASELPIPKSFGVASIDNINYHFMSFVEGVSLDKLWSSLTKSQKESIQTQLSVILRHVRSLPLPSDPAIGSGSPPRCKDIRVRTRISSSRICTEEDFNGFLLSNPFNTDWGVSPFYLRMIRSRMRTDHRMCVTHGDLRPANITVQRKDANSIQINGLVDWGNSGVYPEYWEYAKALSLFRYLAKEEDWYTYLPTQGMGCYIDEYFLDKKIGQLV